ncbi:ImmA/IrrE family metallo-endopeptidase [Citrobacter koseri]|uniref:ImmA/IrrE family metallo-endopeptidase n=2 Tax=Enterobacteriaceae TaxID=543 RepID=UPI001F3E0958|nr:ImmA/IrrE family metallo-endopeptidase [Citrobacter koseri]MDQ2324553.1 ImmA/IrrE family metallo-endopeptidase [Citrobacter koseri]WOJ22201.1 ImmA/IrrE family metallo-endopeptidase [Citrobacter koseri]
MEPSTYVLRGNRVAPMSMNDITSRAINYSAFFNLRTLKKKKSLDKAFELLSEYGITLRVVEDHIWFRETYDLTSGHYDHVSLTISVPNRIFELACKGEREALFVLFHELGHLILGHRPLLHKANKPASQEEDAEWQADFFAEIVLKDLGYDMGQLAFDFF